MAGTITPADIGDAIRAGIESAFGPSTPITDPIWDAVALLIGQGIIDGIIGEIDDGDYIRRDGSNLAGDTPSGGGGGAPTNATYVTMSSNGSLSAERVSTSSSTINVVDGTTTVTWNVVPGGISHGDLADLTADDHTQYLLTSGVRAMAGALDMGGFAITNVGNVDGVDVSGHASRHNPGGADAIATASATTITGSNALGSATSVARSDHDHALGSNTVGTTQIVNDAVTYAKIQNVTDARLLGRSAGSSGDVQEITVGAGLVLSGGALVGPANSHLFTSSGSWDVAADIAAGATHFHAILVGPGGGGGSGSSTTGTGSQALGGTGGGGGARVEISGRLADLTGPVAVTVGTGGTGGTAVANPNNGNPGNAGSGPSTLVDNSARTIASAYPGGGGAGGTPSSAASGGAGGGSGAAGGNGSTAASTGGGPGTGDNTGKTGGGGGGSPNTNAATASTEYGGAGGGGRGVGVAATSTGGSAIWGGAGGGIGGGHTSSAGVNTIVATAGGAQRSSVSGAGGAAGTTSGTTPTNGADGTNGDLYTPGTAGGGGGGATNTAINAGRGGDAGLYGNGGGGGGAAATANSGRGGNGANGVVLICVW